MSPLEAVLLLELLLLLLLPLLVPVVCHLMRRP
jgi:hypothetical protein